MKSGITRRTFLGGALAFGALGVAGCASRPSGSPSGRLPTQGEYLIRNAFVMTMEPGVADIPEGNVHVRAGRIVAVGAGVEAPGAEVLDGRKMSRPRRAGNPRDLADAGGIESVGRFGLCSQRLALD